MSSNKPQKKLVDPVFFGNALYGTIAGKLKKTSKIVEVKLNLTTGDHTVETLNTIYNIHFTGFSLEETWRAEVMKRQLRGDL